ncbi:hypothetical protein QQX98_001245 [Neonectria punicea]|uniref:CCHC-type domain-containing protein n=1 Tax=Neonectria punicea TaxID=979145 RepID=A0ABR1HR04_9HYPO
MGTKAIRHPFEIIDHHADALIAGAAPSPLSQSDKRRGSDPPKKPEGNQPKKPRPTIRCHHCHQLGHRAAECPAKQEEEAARFLRLGQDLAHPGLREELAQLRDDFGSILGRIERVERVIQALAAAAPAAVAKEEAV